MAGYQWFEQYCKITDDEGIPVEIVEEVWGTPHMCRSLRSSSSSQSPGKGSR